ncbi:MAG: hypothetical protein J6X01_06315, partial [Bacteroidales bacterium]|nr:hypothetical protein [Bacteroidales bacterium]
MKLKKDYWKETINLKKLLLCMIVLLSVSLINAQTGSPKKYAHGFSTATSNAGNVSYTLGLPFAKQLESNSYSVDEGVMQAQLIRLDMVLAGVQNDSL